MPLDAEGKKIHTEGVWASAGSADRIDPDAVSLTPTLSRTVGWPDSFSSDAGDTPRRRVMNQRFREIDGAINDWFTMGIPLYDAEIDYVANQSIAQVAGTPYRCIVDNGPSSTVVGPTDDAQTSWEVLEGSVGLPAAPNAPTAAPGNGRLEWRWHCPRDHGAEITSFMFQGRVQGDSWNPARIEAISPSSAHKLQTGLTNGVTYEARVAAINSQGQGPWSNVGSGAPEAVVPGRVVSIVGIGGQ